MKEKKQSANWNIAATHYLTAGLVIPLLLGIVLYGIFKLFPPITSVELTVIISLLFAVPATWLGVMYSAGYLEKTYIMNDRMAVVKTATLYKLIVPFAWYALRALAAQQLLSKVFLYTLIEIFFYAWLFYFFSKKYIANRPASDGQAVQQTSSSIPTA